MRVEIWFLKQKKMEMIKRKIHCYCFINTIFFGILVKEKSSNEIKISLRSKNYVDVSHIAKVFNGGGHVRAAGLTVFNETIENATKMVVAETLKYI